jgi:aspartate aminotransferase-like enzyme
MVCVRDRRPFSLDSKLENLDSHLPPAKSLCEVRLLAVDPAHRNSRVFRGLSAALARHVLDRGYDLGLISGTTRQLKLYTHMGFVPFGPLVGIAGAEYQPMYMTRELFERIALPVLGETVPGTDGNGGEPVMPESFLPGPVSISADVRAAFSEAPVSHRGEAFMEKFQELRARLCRLANARKVEILLGSGTLANDVIAGQIASSGRRGIILANGEFGWRLVDHSSRLGIAFEVFEAPWGEPFDYAALAARLDAVEDVDWLWGVHCETSTGILNDLEALKGLCAGRGVRLCMDCISSLGVVPLNLEGVHLASGVSGKGLGSFPGLSMVFYHHDVAPSSSLPRYLDLGWFAAKEGVPFTHSSNLLRALGVALRRFESGAAFEERAGLSAWARGQLRAAGFSVVAPEEHASPAVITIALPAGVRSRDIGARLEEAGFLLSHMSEYLLDRNWMQVCMMGECSRRSVEALLDCFRRERAAAAAYSNVTE